MASSSQLICRETLSHRGVVELAQWSDSISAWPAGSHVWGHYAEATPTGPAICRTENVSACHPGVAALVNGTLRDAASNFLGVPASDFKDKINYKQPGGAGFLPHQDQVAYPGVNHVVSLLVAIDECTRESGCLWIAEGVDRELPTDDRGVVTREASALLDWQPIELDAGDALYIAGFAPHYSEPNRTSSQRRVLIASYAPTSSAYTRGRYYDSRHSVMSERTDNDGRFRISTLADFNGREIKPDETAQDRCSHG